MPYTAERGTEYMARGGCRMGCTCMCCGQESIKFVEEPTALDHTACLSLSRRVRCTACGSSWLENYYMEGLSDLDDQNGG